MTDLSQPVPIRDWVGAYMPWLCDHTPSPYTQATYRSTLGYLDRDDAANGFIGWVETHGGHIDIRVIDTFCARPRRGTPTPMPSTYNRDLNVIRALLKWCWKHHLCGFDYYTEASNLDQRKVRKVKKAVRDVEFQLLWYSDLSVDERVWLGVLRYAGLRRFELCGLTVGQIDLDARVLRNVLRKEDEEQDIPYGVMADYYRDVDSPLARRLGDWEEALAKVVAERGWDPANSLCVRADDRAAARIEHRDGWVNRDLDAILKRVGLAPGLMKPHDLRRYSVTSLLSFGVPQSSVMWLHNHKDTRTSQLYNLEDPNVTRQEWLRRMSG